VRVRHAIPQDASAIARVHVRSWQVAYRGLLDDAVLDRLSVEEREVMWRALLSEVGSGSGTLVAEVAAEIVGFCSLMTAGEEDGGVTCCELAAIYVTPESYRQGIGSALLSRSLEHARSDGCGEMILWVLRDNRPARAFYQRFGFKPDGVEKWDAATGQVEVRLRATLTAPRG